MHDSFPAAPLELAVTEFLAAFALRHIDPASMRSAKMLLKDQLAVQVGVAQLPWSREVRRCLAKPRPGTSSVVGERMAMDAGDAAYLNATYGGGFEYDDVAGNDFAP